MAGRTRKPAPQEAVVPSNSLVASAVRYPGKTARVYMPSTAWQQEAYRHYGICGEARYAATYFGHSLSKVTLHAEELTADGMKKAATDSVAAQAMDALFSGAAGQSQMLTALGIHLTVAGDCYLVGREVPATMNPETGIEVGTGGDVWEVISIHEMHVTGTKWTIKYGNGMNDVPLGDDDVVIRIWRPHPANRIEADSPFRSLLPVLNEIEWLTKHIFAQCSSRLAGAGLLFMPQGMTFPTPPETLDANGNPTQFANEADAFTVLLADVMMSTLADPSLPSSHVPGIITAPGDEIDKARLMQFWSNLDEKALEMRQSAIHRFALGMDLPPEKLLGMSSNGGTGGGTSNGVSHWGAWQVDEDTITLHIEPMLELIVNALTVGYLRNATGGAEIVRYDSSNLRLRPDRSKEAMELYDRGLLSLTALLREVGFNPVDMPNADERRLWLLSKVASGSSTPEMVAAALSALGVDLEVAVSSEPATPTAPPPSLEEHPTRPKTPDDEPGVGSPTVVEQSVSPALLAACDALMYRALERAGNRLRQKVAVAPECRAYETHTLIQANGTATKVMEDAFSCAPEVLEGIADVDKVVPVLNAYSHALLAEQAPHERTRMAVWLAKQL